MRSNNKTNEESLNLYQKLARIRKQVEVLRKNKSGFGYKYVSEDELLAKLTGQFKKYNLLCLPYIVRNTLKVEPISYVKNKPDKKTGIAIEENVNEVLVSADMIFTWIDITTGEKLEIPWSIVGQQADASQAMGSALTYCIRYYYLKFFNISTTDDDPDNWRSKQRAAEEEEAKAILDGIIENIDSLSKKYVADNNGSDEAKSTLSELVKKYIDTGNYKKITEPAVAGKLLEEITALVGQKEEE